MQKYFKNTCVGFPIFYVFSRLSAQIKRSQAEIYCIQLTFNVVRER